MLHVQIDAEVRSCSCFHLLGFSPLTLLSVDRNVANITALHAKCDTKLAGHTDDRLRLSMAFGDFQRVLKSMAG